MNHFFRTLISEDQAFFDPRVSRCRLVAYNGQPWRKGEDPLPGFSLGDPILDQVSDDAIREAKIINAIGEAGGRISVGHAWSETNHESPQVGDFSAVTLIQFPEKLTWYHSTIIVEDDASGLIVDKALPCVFCDILYPYTPAEIYPICLESLACPTCKAKLQVLRDRGAGEVDSSLGSPCDFCHHSVAPEMAFTLSTPKSLPFSSESFLLAPVIHLACAQTMGLEVRPAAAEEAEEIRESNRQQDLKLNSHLLLAAVVNRLIGANPK
jgi:uncharacterized protein YbaR (Trm112 family)